KMDPSSASIIKKSLKYLHKLRQTDAFTKNSGMFKYLTAQWLELKLEKSGVLCSNQELLRHSVCPGCLGQQPQACQQHYTVSRRRLRRTRKRLTKRLGSLASAEAALASRKVVRLVCPTCGRRSTTRQPAGSSSTPGSTAPSSRASATPKTPIQSTMCHSRQPGSSSQGKANKHNKTLCRVKLLQQRQYATGANLSPSASAVSSSGSRSSPGGGMASFLSLLGAGTPKR
ncbi:hypothetical protein BOX15_Mlig014568g1, partial [Macrostomum lignano]